MARPSICYAVGGEQICQAPRGHLRYIALPQLVFPHCCVEAGRRAGGRKDISLQKEYLPCPPLLITTD